jgi:preprotein translocase subunit YajC
MWSDAHAQAGGAGGQAGGPLALIIQMAPILLIFVVMYLLILRPQQQQQKKTQQMLKQLKKGDRVLTSGGIMGTVVGVDDAKVVLKIAEETKVEFTKSAVVQLLAGDAR